MLPDIAAAMALGLLLAPQTPEQMVRAELCSIREAPLYYRAPIDASLDLGNAAVGDLGGGRLAKLAGLPSEPEDGLGDTGPRPVLLGARLVNWQSAAPPAPRATISFGPGLNIGKGAYSWRATVCNATDVPQAIDQGDVEQAANSVGIPLIGYGEAQNANALQRNRSKPVVGSLVAQGIGAIGTSLIASGIISASGTWGAAAAGVMYGATQLVSYFKSVTPADLSSRFSGATLLQDGSTRTLPPRGQPNHCGTVVVFSRSVRGASVKSGVAIF